MYKLPERWKLIAEAKVRSDRGPERKGQAISNVAITYARDLVVSLTATEVDCFNDDSKIDAFLNKLYGD